eukprot:328115_1
MDLQTEALYLLKEACKDNSSLIISSDLLKPVIETMSDLSSTPNKIYSALQVIVYIGCGRIENKDKLLEQDILNCLVLICHPNQPIEILLWISIAIDLISRCDLLNSHHIWAISRISSILIMYDIAEIVGRAAYTYSLLFESYPEEPILDYGVE